MTSKAFVPQEVLEVAGISYAILGGVDEDTQQECWGIEIKTRLFGQPECRKISAISPDLAFMKKLQAALADGFVTPSCADEVIENFIEEYL